MQRWLQQSKTVLSLLVTWLLLAGVLNLSLTTTSSGSDQTVVVKVDPTPKITLAFQATPIVVVPTPPPVIETPTPAPVEITPAATPLPTIAPIEARNLAAIPQTLNAPIILVRFRSVAPNSNLFEKLLGLEPIQAGRFQPVDYLPAGNGKPEQLVAVIESADEDKFKVEGLEYSRLDDEADTARYYSVMLPDKPAPDGEGWLDPKWQVLEQLGNRVIIKVDLPFYLGFGVHSRLEISKLPPWIYLPGLTSNCPCPMLAAQVFSTGAVRLNTPPLPIKDRLKDINEADLGTLINHISKNEVPGKGALNTRYTGSAGSVYMAERIYLFFFALGLSVEYDTFQEVALGTVATNVVAEQFGTKDWLISKPVLLIGHYDTVGERNLKGISTTKLLAPGANDNAVGIAGMLEVARLLALQRFERPIRYIAFGAEEQGMLGSRHYVSESLKANPSAVINIDSFGSNPSSDDQVILAYSNHADNLKDALVAYEKKYNLNLQLVLRLGQPFFRSDDLYFDNAGLSSLVLTDSFSTQSPHNHTQDDTIANLNLGTVRKVIQLALVSVAEEAGIL